MAKKNTNTNTEATEATVTGNDAPFTLEDGVEIPQATRRGTWDFLKDMKVNQSFLISGEDAQVKARQAYQSAVKTHKYKVSVRQVEGGVRIWRTA